MNRFGSTPVTAVLVSVVLTTLALGASQPQIMPEVSTPGVGQGRGDLAAVEAFLPTACDGLASVSALSDSPTTPPLASLPQWTWVKGSALANQSGTYGTLGVAHPDNAPGGRWGGASWTTSDGSFWLFGGRGYDSIGWSGRLNDLWRYDPASGDWTWVKGSNLVNDAGVYGTRGVPHPDNVPVARFATVSWTTSDDTLWLFGGASLITPSGTMDGRRNDLWKYNPVTGHWTWMKGSNLVDQPGVPGTLGVPHPDNTPGARCGAVSWTTADDALWMFGGSGFGAYNDLWRYDPDTGNWTWIKGSTGVDPFGPVYGTRGVPHPDNIPGARSFAVSWTTRDGFLWLFGGWGIGGTGIGELNDLWRFNPTTGDWTWMKGNDGPAKAGTYGTLGVPHPDNTPGGRHYGGDSWTTADGCLWMLGGAGYGADPTQKAGTNDLWRYDPTTDNWTWMKGSNRVNPSGRYGTVGVPDPHNTPSAHSARAGSWTTSDGSLWLFDGGGYDSAGNPGSLNDLWRLDIPPSFAVVFQTDGTPGASLDGHTTQTVVHGMDCTPVTAVAPDGYHFVKWTKDGTDYATSNPLTVANVTESMTLTAHFAINIRISGTVRDGAANGVEGVEIEATSCTVAGCATDAAGAYALGPVGMPYPYTGRVMPWKPRDAAHNAWVFEPCLRAYTQTEGLRANQNYTGREIAGIRDLIAYFYNLALSRAPEAGAVDAWQTGYFDYAVSLGIDVRFVAREMGRQFFLSAEYAARGRTNAEFLVDCYRVFLQRDPSSGELGGWLGGEWNRAQAMTIIAESPEFAAMIQAMYPGRGGVPTRNLITTLYLGILDRLADVDGLQWWEGVMAANTNRREVAKSLARALFGSAEFLAGNPTNEDRVVRLYRAFMGRFPSDAEIAYWTAELDAGRVTLDALIEIFGDSPEFTAILARYFGLGAGVWGAYR